MGIKSSIVHQIQWHDGMALLPHHFQQLDLRLFQLISKHLNLVSSHHWGIQELSFDEIGLPDGLLRITNAEIVMPDGLIFHYTDKDEMLTPLEVDLKEFKPHSSQETLTIQLILPAQLEGVSPIQAATPRFRSVESPPIPDENTDDNPISIPRLIPCFQLHVGEKIPAKYIGFPILKIKFIDGAFAVTEFTPPCFQIEESSHLWELCIETTRKIREKAIALCEKWQNQIGTNLLRETSEMLKPLVAMLPTLESLINSKEISPFELYNELMEGAGFVAQLNLSAVPPRFEKYNHNNIDACIMPILAYIKHCIDHLSIEYAIFPFKKNDKVFSFKLNASYFNSSKEIFVGLRSKPGIQPKQIEIWMNEAVIVSDDAIQKVQTKRIIGASRQLVDGEKLYKMSPPRDITLFSINLDQQFIQPNQYLHIFNPSDSEYYRPADVVLYILKDDQNSFLEAA